MRTGRRRRRRRVATMLASVSMVAVAGWGAAAILGARDTSAPPMPHDDHLSSGRLVPVVVETPFPLAERAPAHARAVTVALHAFLEGSGGLYDFDYEGVRGTDDTWWVRFAQFPFPTRAERTLAELQSRVDAEVEDVRAERAELGRAMRRLRHALDDARAREARRVGHQLAALRHSRRGMKSILKKINRKVAMIQERRLRVLGRPASHRTRVTVVVRHGMLVVEDVETSSPEAASLMDVIGYAEPLADVKAWGAEYYDATFRRRNGPTNDVGVEVSGFWTGSLVSGYEETCRPQVLTRAGRVVWTDRRAPYEDAPPEEELRDSLRIRFEIDYNGNVDDLALRMLCEGRTPRARVQLGVFSRLPGRNDHLTT